MKTINNPLTPLEVDRLSQNQGANLKAFKNTFSHEVFKISAWRSWWGVTRAIAAFVLIPYLISMIAFEASWQLLWQIPLLLFLWVCHGSAMVGLIILAHDCGHYAFSKSRRVCHAVGHLMTSFVMVGFHNWQISHNHHHAYSQMRKMDTDWPEKMVTADEYSALSWFDKFYILVGYTSPFGLVVGFLAGNFRRTFLALGYPQIPINKKQKRRLFFSTTLMLLCSGSLQIALLYYTGWLGLIKYYWGGAACGFVLGSLITQVQHTNADTLVFDKEAWTPFRGHVVCTFNVFFPRLIEFLAFDFNYHIAHHISPLIPWYHLRQATEELKAQYPEYIQERALSWVDLRRFWKNPVLNGLNETGVYNMRAIPK